MFAPDEVEMKATLADVFSGRLAVDAYSYSVQNTMIGKIPTEPDWLNAVRANLARLSTAGDGWDSTSPDIFGRISAGVARGASGYQAFAPTVDRLLRSDPVPADELLALLDDLLRTMDDCRAEVEDTRRAWQGAWQRFADVQPALSASIDEGWSALADEEQAITRIATALAKLQDELAQHEDAVASAAIGGGDSKDVVASAVSIVYDLVTTTGELAVPYLGAAKLAYTIGKTFYDVISNTVAAVDDLRKIAGLQTEAGLEAQALAGTKMVLRTLQDMELRFTAIHGEALPALVRVYEGEAAKLQAVIDGVKAGADPRGYPDIDTLGVAAQIWAGLHSYAADLQTLRVEPGVPVVLDVVTGQIRQGDTAAARPTQE